ncbi:hypothetical protein HHA04nite_00530 [Halomonas halophila]|uniref:Uncharacterized protein n=1 Tax=Halomonas halophila TaxID=29573 RepID=A0ABQ0U3F0_9GAMM|nr:hypothetical protein HHA04nite_00530 [Halomonas halophila]
MRLHTAAFPCVAQWHVAVRDSITVAGAASDWITDFPFTLALLVGACCACRQDRLAGHPRVRRKLAIAYRGVNAAWRRWHEVRGAGDRS